MKEESFMISTSPEQKTIFSCKSDESRQAYTFQRGQRVIFEEEEAEIIRITPLLVIKTKNRVVCGALQNMFASVMI
jgi:hypothetical protein